MSRTQCHRKKPPKYSAFQNSHEDEPSYFFGIKFDGTALRKLDRLFDALLELLEARVRCAIKKWNKK